jgi:argininosuccinate synthase
MDANLLHTSYEGGELEDPWFEANDEMWLRSVSPENAPDQPTYLELGFETSSSVSRTAISFPSMANA